LIRFLFVAAERGLRIIGPYDLYMVETLIIIGFIVKLGIFPLHFWFPSVISISSWFSCF
jgi:formate hydrogenlyase subunit 3/multisubunit Na+/H+ antiporter MnhD subunit